ncbi:MAG: MauE/DoxX family redox-associated membrane protein [Acidobacteriota bacterium]
MKERAAAWLDRLGRWTLAGIFLYAAIPKILDPLGFAEDIGHYALVPDAVVNTLAVVLPWIEAVAALALLTGFAAEGALLTVNLLLLVFLGALGQAWIRGLDIDCGCFGHAQDGAPVLLALLRDLGFLALGFTALAVRARRVRLQSAR